MEQVEMGSTNSGQASQANAEQSTDESGSTTSINQSSRDSHHSTPGDALRTLPTEAQERGTRFVSAQAMQAKLFSVYDAAAAAEDALALVQEQLTLTLDRSYYEADEIESMAAQLDYLLTLDTLELSDADLVSDLSGEDLVAEE